MKSAADETANSTLPHPIRPNMFWAGCRVFLRLFFVFWLRYRFRGIDRIPTEEGGLLLINHQSMLDPFLVGAPFERPVTYIARDSLLRIPLVGWIFKQTYVMTIKRNSAGTESLRESVRRMKHGFLVGIFPEGTRTNDGSVGPLKPGFVALIRRSKFPVIPVGIAGAHESLPRGAWFPRPRRVCLVYGEPLTHDDLEQYTKRGREQELVELIRQKIIACQQEAEDWRRR